MRTLIRTMIAAAVLTAITGTGTAAYAFDDDSLTDLVAVWGDD
jgi:hypothetical protein